MADQDWIASDQNQQILLKKLTKSTELGRDGEILKTLQQIVSVLNGNKIDPKEIGKAISSNDSKNSGISKAKTNPLNDTTTSKASKDLASSLLSTNKMFGGLNNALSSSKKKFDGFLSGIANNSSAAEGASKAMKSFAEGLIGFTAVSALDSMLKQQVESYRQLSDTGQSFGGSILNMNIAAAHASMSLNEFTKIMSNPVTAQVNARTNGQYIQMQKTLRSNIAEFGAFGLTTEEVNDTFSNYLSTATQYGPIDAKAREDLTKSFQGLLSETTAYSAVTGRSRREMLKDINEGANNVIAMASMMALPAGEAVKAKASMDKINGVFAAFGDTSSKFFTQSLGDAMGAGGLAMSKMGHDLSEAGLSNLIQPMDQLAAKTRNGTATQEDAIAVFQQLQDQVQGNLPALQAQAASGNEAAKEMIKMAGEIQNAGGAAAAYAKQQKALKEQSKMEPITKAMLNFQQAMSTLWSSFKDGFLTGVKPVFDAFSDLSEGGVVENMAKVFEDFGKQMGIMIAMLSPIVKGIVDTFVSFDQAMKKFMEYLGVAGDKASGIAGILTVAAVIFSAILLKKLPGLLISGVSKLFNKITGKTQMEKTIMAPGAKIITSGLGPGGKGGSGLSGLVEGLEHGNIGNGKFGNGKFGKGVKPGRFSKLKGFGKGALGFALTAGLGASSMFGGGDGDDMFGGMGDLMGGAGDLFSNGGEHLTEKETEKGTSKVAGKEAEKAGEKVGEKGALKVGEKAAEKVGEKGALKVAGKFGAKEIAKHIPILGALAGLGFSGYEAMRGNWKGAGMELASTAATQGGDLLAPFTGGVSAVAGNVAGAGLDVLAAQQEAEFGDKKEQEDAANPTPPVPPEPVENKNEKTTDDLHDALLTQNDKLDEISKLLLSLNRNVKSLPENMG